MNVVEGLAVAFADEEQAVLRWLFAEWKMHVVAVVLWIFVAEKKK